MKKLAVVSFAACGAVSALFAAPLGHLTPCKSADIPASPWGVQSGDNERVTLFDRAGELGVKWTRFLAAWLRYVDAVVAHAKDRVTHWAIWNEPNHHSYWAVAPDAAAYGKLVRLTAARIRAAQPGAVLIAGAGAMRSGRNLQLGRQVGRNGCRFRPDSVDRRLASTVLFEEDRPGG